jgi:hypothetical protein
MIEEDPRMGALRYMHSEVNTEIAWHTHLNGQFDRILVKRSSAGASCAGFSA